MSLPVPEPGLVIRYAYLWHSEAAAGREEGMKDRPCAVVAMVRDIRQQRVVYVLPITHAPPKSPVIGTEVPRLVKERLRLDADRSWVVVSEANVFVWPGPDLRAIPGDRSKGVAYGFLPPRFFRAIRDRFLALDAERRLTKVERT